MLQQSYYDEDLDDMEEWDENDFDDGGIEDDEDDETGAVFLALPAAGRSCGNG